MRSFVDLTNQPEDFFQLLPEEWRVEIAPVWPNYEDSSRIFCVKEANEVLAGGIVFGSVSPDTQGYATIAQAWFDKGYLYFGFLFVSPDHRGKGLGRFWMEELRKAVPNQHFWLAIEDADLVKFYEPHGFTVRQEVDNEGTKERILSD